ncbi:MAG: putative periplasmic binding abc transporter protein [Osedax symbiont Rs2]|nr:MAG: putative periplasmic binding abc transporter protein [Osedax symbiont Rs2]
MKFKKLLLATTASLMLLSTAASADITRIGIATEPYPPFSVPDAAGNYNGWEIEIANAVCAAAKLECEIVASAWDGIIPSLKAEKIDVIAASLSVTAARLKVIDFSNKYYQTGAALIGAANSSIAPTAAGVGGKTIGIQSASIHQAYAAKHFPDASIREYQSQDEANQDLFAGRIDATLADVLTLDAFLASEEGQACCKLLGIAKNDVEILGEGIGFGLRKGNDELKAKLNAAIDQIRSDGTYAKISAKYFDFNIYGD